MGTVYQTNLHMNNLKDLVQQHMKLWYPFLHVQNDHQVTIYLTSECCFG